MNKIKEEPTELMKKLWSIFEFEPDINQKNAILHMGRPLFLPAAPGSGKTRVLLWRTVNLIVTHGVPPNEIFLSTFTEKAAKQLRDGLRTYLTAASEENKIPYDISNMFIGTTHSLCRRVLTDRRFSTDSYRNPKLVLLDELGQYLFVRKTRNWKRLESAPKSGKISNTRINEFFRDRGRSRHKAITHLISFFNRLSEELIEPDEAKRKTSDRTILDLIDMYEEYLRMLAEYEGINRTDLSLLQRIALEHLEKNPNTRNVFRHVIIDEYQDTNTVQERLFFRLAQGYKNICVVGDDDQALYRFRGATVENFVNFPNRCKSFLEIEPRKIVLDTNYRSLEGIVSYSTKFIHDDSCDWKNENANEVYRVEKDIFSHRKGNGTEVVYTSRESPEDAAEEIAGRVRELIDEKKVDDPNQIAYLFPSLHSNQTKKMKEALEKKGLQVYAPRAGNFLDVSESKELFGLILQLFEDLSHDHSEFRNWSMNSSKIGDELRQKDPYLDNFMKAKKEELREIKNDYDAFMDILQIEGWKESDVYEPNIMQETILSNTKLSEKAKKALKNGLFLRSVKRRSEVGNPFNLRYVITRSSSVDWNFLDLFYQICGFSHFKRLFDLAEKGDEGPICNLSLISQYIARYVDEYTGLISGHSMSNNFTRISFLNYLYVLYRREENEYEDANDPFPKGRIPFLTIHQAKGLEFPVVVMANPRKATNKLQNIERIVQGLIDRKGEPLDKVPLYDAMRMFYVGISRARNLLIVPCFGGNGQWINPPFEHLKTGKTKISELEVSSVCKEKLVQEEIPLNYSFTGDFQLYMKCPRQYMIFKKYDFVPSRSQTMFFGSLVHQTLEDLHQSIISKRSS